MCVILACKTRKPDIEELKACEKTNPHGGSIAYIKKGLVVWKKGIEAQEVFQISQKIALPFVIHFRIASVGTVCKPLCHPFPITYNAQTELEGKAPSVLFHNGSWYDWKDWVVRLLFRTKLKLPSGLWSDSRAMAWLCYHSNGAEVLRLLSEQKVAILNNRGEMQITGSSWTYEDGISFSNTYHRITAVTYPANTKFHYGYGYSGGGYDPEDYEYRRQGQSRKDPFAVQTYSGRKVYDPVTKRYVPKEELQQVTEGEMQAVDDFMKQIEGVPTSELEEKRAAFDASAAESRAHNEQALAEARTINQDQNYD